MEENSSKEGSVEEGNKIDSELLFHPKPKGENDEEPKFPFSSKFKETGLHDEGEFPRNSEFREMGFQRMNSEGNNDDWQPNVECG